jgi:transcriptional regulator with XRE-family HTH domain
MIRSELKKRINRKAGITQKVVAEKAGVDQTWLSRFIKDGRVSVTIERGSDLLSAVGCEIAIVKSEKKRDLKPSEELMLQDLIRIENIVIREIGRFKDIILTDKEPVSKDLDERCKDYAKWLDS